VPTTTYHTRDGVVVPSVTTAIARLDKGRGLLLWANRLGLAGTRLQDHNTDTQEAGTKLHATILGAIADGSSLPSGSAAYDNAALWLREHTVEPLLVEEHFVSERHGFGGTPDLVALTDGHLTVLDLKSSKTVYLEHRLQVAAYYHLLLENGFAVERACVLALGGDFPQYDTVPPDHLDIYWRAFLGLLQADRALKQIGD